MAKAIMIMGTASGVGKSTLTAGLCRLFRQRGLRVAPFKAQNISDRVHVLADGKTIARSSALAAMACGLDPKADMNPVLMVPAVGAEFQLFLSGEAHPMTDFSTLFNHVVQAYARLRADHDLIIIEGAGSPVELNLLNHDIVNMRFAMHVGTPVVLVGDISRGGVFASVYGTLALMPEEQRQTVKGIVINKFKGIAGSFAEGKAIMEQLTRRPVLGLLPYADIALEDEDNCAEGPPKTQDFLIDRMNAGAPGQSYPDFIEAALDNLARHVETFLDVDALFGIADKGV